MKKIMSIILGMFLVALTITSAFAYGGLRDPAVQEAVENNDYDAWKTVMDSHNSEERFQRHTERYESREAMKTAIEDGDYDAWKEVVGDRPIADVITEENFSLLQDMHEARMNGDEETAQAIAEELGLDQNKGKGHGRGQGRGNGRMGGCPNSLE